MENLINEYDIDFSMTGSPINDNDENLVLSGETVVIGNITLWELGGILLISSVILIFVLLILLKLIKYFNSYESLDIETQKMLNASFNLNSSVSSISSQATTPQKSKEHLIVLSVGNLEKECRNIRVDLYKENEVDCPKDSFA